MFEALREQPWRKLPGLPKGLRVYAVGDVHGRADALESVFARIDADRASRPITRTVEIFLGDYVDRGPASRAVLDLLVARSRLHEVLTLKGNHEVFFLDFLENPSHLEAWRQNGGLATLISYGLKPSLKPSAAEQDELAKELRSAVPPTHLTLLARAPSWFKCGDFFFAHAGVRPGIPLEQQRDDDLLWIRNEFLLHEKAFEKIIVHGHTPVAAPEVHFNRINLDIGAYATGQLACLAADNRSIGFV